MICDKCKKKIPKKYIKAHKKFRNIKNIANIIKAARQTKLHVFDKEI